MELFYSKNIAEGITVLDAEESNHCVRVLRHKSGDVISIVDGAGSLYKCEIIEPSPKGLVFKVIEKQENYGSHPYKLHVAVAPPKNIERFEWFAEKSTEIGVDEITPVLGEYSERKVFKRERVERILVSAAKQSNKGAVPILYDAVCVADFINGFRDNSLSGEKVRKLICYCGDVSAYGATKISLKEAISGSKNIAIMIGPEGDFSRKEIELAIEKGWQPVSLGYSRLRIETAAITAVVSVYMENTIS